MRWSLGAGRTGKPMIVFLLLCLALVPSPAWAAIDYYCFEDCRRNHMNYAPQYCESVCSYTPQQRPGDYAVYPTYEPPGTSPPRNEALEIIDQLNAWATERNRQRRRP